MTLSASAIPESVADRLERETIVWLTTVGRSGTPVPTPVWFEWSGTEFLIFSRPETAKLANIEKNPQVALNFNSSAQGGEVSVFTGTGRVDADGPTPAEWAAYVEKYSGDMAGLEYTPEKFQQDYSTLIRVTPGRLRGW
ncbi:TIGR03667 family PPOX class F420-dependent oxidoreductase [Rhodococcus jostii]|uniref:PPOX class probable F420-dependent enzyme, Rv3369 family n=1 Tax=Rhodococcus jostii TaxID=132919 RepID=A0A1H5DKE1_RHOJO|nr:TIGR03667 family PPOX class F420-dependent oxidoreductase [Rhodococcus jostii]SED79304.1 PPOX class probable F420-dependent enzyme, Rv3369 family [Rhodococcus jostii]